MVDSVLDPVPQVVAEAVDLGRDAPAGEEIVVAQLRLQLVVCVRRGEVEPKIVATVREIANE